MYLIVNVDVKDAAAYEQYRAKVPSLIRDHGGEYLVVVEAWSFWKRLVVLRFPDMAAVQNLSHDPEYQPLKALRHRVAQSEIVAVEGV